MRLAAIDVGTNTTRLLVAETKRGGYRDLDRRLVFTRLGEGVDATKKLAPAAIERTLRAIADYCSVAGDFAVTKLRVAATSAVRDALNQQEFLSAARTIAGVDPEALTGDQEARLSFLGAVSDLPTGDYLVCDIGGGSTELVLGSSDKGVFASKSLDIGAVRLTERFLRSDPPAPGELETMESNIDNALDDAGQTFSQAGRAQFVGVAGTITTLAALKIGLTKYNPERTHHLALTLGEVDRLYRMLASMTLAERKRLRALPQGRADVIVAGAAILYRCMLRWSFSESITSERDILDGLILEMI